MSSDLRTHPRSALTAGLALCLLLCPGDATAFTQSGLGTDFGFAVPMGHEWVTRLAALEVLGGDTVLKPDPNDPRRSWRRGLARSSDISAPDAAAEANRIRAMKVADTRYGSTYKPVLDAIIGERWVDIGGFNVTNAKLGPVNCHDAMTQEPAEIQYDHYMRRYDDREAAGGVTSARASQERFVSYFVAAAMAPPGALEVWDGGGYAARVTVDNNYFLFGRAMHLFEDSFSAEHTVRDVDTNYETVVQVKGYMCSAGAEQHSHSNTSVVNYQSGDVIWLPGTRLNSGLSTYLPSLMKDRALVATEATKDLWAAVIRTMGQPRTKRRAVAQAEAEKLVQSWLAIDETKASTWYNDEAHRDDTYVLATNQTGKGRTVSDCMKGLGEPSGQQAVRVRALEEAQRFCAYNQVPVPGFEDRTDPSLKEYYNWDWRSSVWKKPDNGWKYPDMSVQPETRVMLRSAVNGKYMVAKVGLVDQTPILAQTGDPILWTQVKNTAGSYYYRAVNASLFLSYSGLWHGNAMFYHSVRDSAWNLQKLGNGMWNLLNTRWGQVMYVDGNIPQLNMHGRGNVPAGQWDIVEVPVEGGKEQLVGGR